jgi:error-prone DNA polymerase
VFAHLHVHSNFSFLDGGSTVAALIRRAQALGMTALALTDHHGLYGAVRFVQAARAAGIRPIVGAEMTLVTGEHLVLLARDREGFRSLCRLVTEAQLAGEKGHAQLTWETLDRCRRGLFCLSGCERGVVAAPLLAGLPSAARAAAARLREIMGREALAIEVQNMLYPHSPALMRGLADVARELGLPLVATNNVHHATKGEFPIQDTLFCVQTLTTLDEGHPLRKPNAEQYLKSAQAMARLFVAYPEAIEGAAAVAATCQDSMELGVLHFPDFPLPEGETPSSVLYHLCRQGVNRRYHPLTTAVTDRLKHELGVIDHLGFATYFLVMWDLVRFARRAGIRCSGRGSAADSLVTYVLGITDVDPIAHGLLFERFLNPARRGAPDIDIDFDANRRDEVIDYVYRRYGREHAAMVCTVSTLGAKSAVRDLGKALDFPPEEIDRFAKALPHTGADRVRAALERLPELRDAQFPVKKLEMLLDLCEKVAGFPRHLSVHLGGMVVSRERLDELAPLEWSTKGVVVTQWDKDDVEEAGLVKMDLLALKILSAIEETLTLLRETRGIELDLDRLPLDDPRTFALLRSTRTVGVFQVESPGMRGLLGRLQPVVFEDLIAQISLFRPGPLTAQMIEPFVARRHGREPVTYLHPSLEPILRGTYGVLLYQEQVLEIAHALAGFSLAEADLLRRAMTTDRSPQEMAQIQQTFLDGAARQGVTREVAEQVWKSLSAFAAYGFCKAHAAAFARITYQTAYLKAHYPTEFLASILNNEPMGFYSSHTILWEAQRMGIRLAGIDVNRSEARFTVSRAALGARLSALGPDKSGTCLYRAESQEPRAERCLRVGFRQVKGMTDADLDSLITARADGPFLSLAEFCRRTTVSRDVVERLILCGAFDGLHPSRRTLLWQMEGALAQRETEEPRSGEGQLTLAVETAGREQLSGDRARPPVGEATLYERVQWEIESLGLAVEAHPATLFAPLLAPHAPIPAREFARAPHGRRVAVAGVVICRMRPPTRSGAIVLFITMEDETGLIDTVIFPDVYDRDGAAAFSGDLLVIEGKVQRQGRYGATLIAEKVINPLAGRTEDRIDGHTGIASRRLPLRELQAVEESEEEDAFPECTDSLPERAVG